MPKSSEHCLGNESIYFGRRINLLCFCISLLAAPLHVEAARGKKRSCDYLSCILKLYIRVKRNSDEWYCHLCRTQKRLRNLTTFTKSTLCIWPQRPVIWPRKAHYVQCEHFHANHKWALVTVARPKHRNRPGSIFCFFVFDFNIPQRLQRPRRSNHHGNSTFTALDRALRRFYSSTNDFYGMP